MQRSNVIWTLGITSIGRFMVVLDNLVVSTALPVIRVDSAPPSSSSSGL